MTQKILLLGPAGQTGRHILDQALERGHEVRGIERDFPYGFCDHPAFEACEADILNDDIAPYFEGCDTVISAMGLGRDPQTLNDPPPLYTEGAVRIVEAMRKAKLERLVVISAAFADRDVDVPLWFRAATLPLRNIFRQMAEMERVLRVTNDIAWTAARPGWLLNRPHTGDFLTADDGLPAGTLRTRRADLAHFMLDCAEQGNWTRQTPFVARKEERPLESPSALVEELSPF